MWIKYCFFLPNLLLDANKPQKIAKMEEILLKSTNSIRSDKRYDMNQCGVFLFLLFLFFYNIGCSAECSGFLDSCNQMIVT